MAIYINDTPVDPRKFCLSLLDDKGKQVIDENKYARILKKPVFKLDDSKVIKKSTIISGKNFAPKPTQGLLTYFWFKDSDGIQKRLRYAESQNPRVVGGIMQYEYKPERFNIEGQVALLKNSPDKAIFMFLNPSNPTSPFSNMAKKKFAYMDSIEQTLKDAADMSSIQKALTHATNMEEEELVIVAKGLKLLASDDYEVDALRVKLQQYAMNPQTNKLYIRGMTDEMVRIEGRIRNLVDKGVFKIEKRGSSRQWVWNGGPRAGEYIGDYIMNVNEDALQRLFNFIKANLNDYLFDLRNSDQIISADRKGREILAAKPEVKTEVPEHLAAINAPMPDELSLKTRVSSFAEAREYVGEKGYPKNSALIKTLLDGILDGSVTDENVNGFLVKLFEKKDALV